MLVISKSASHDFILNFLCVLISLTVGLPDDFINNLEKVW